ncbi:MAG: thiamine-phosphate kinase [Gemmatimonadota bacterium]|nr:thiamine-phosphate kinase [Gemmatimonadota bacterium]MDP6460212.1 thiamine-phosphate kinase [Gemmatimonadota bacterium]MDP6803284.1 thiamine-phosphate kinase [Gemmatimonadota bacterium]
MIVSELGEAGLIELFRNWTGGSARRVILGPGDDAAILRATGDRSLVVSTDAFREGVHFTREVFSSDEIGHKMMVAALSDLAAMGAEGFAAFVNVHIPPDTPVEFLRGVYLGMDRVADSCGVSIAGGDTVRAPEAAFGITVLGTVEPGCAIRRDGACEGDLICVSGELGKSEAGRLLLTGAAKGRFSAASRSTAESAHRSPWPRFDVSRMLVSLERTVVDSETGLSGVHAVRPSAMMDLSDGLGIDLGRLCEASHVGCELDEDRVPVCDAARRIAARRDSRAVDFALGGGEDFELLFTLSPEDKAVVFETAASAGLALTCVGRIGPVRDGRLLIRPDGSRESLPEFGFDHFPASGFRR